MKLGIAWSEPSTRRGLVMMIGGAAALYNSVMGGHLNVDALMHSASFWLGAAATVAGALGLFVRDVAPSSPSLPPIELQGRAMGAAGGADSRPVADELRNDVLPHGGPGPGPTDRDSTAGWNG